MRAYGTFSTRDGVAGLAVVSIRSRGTALVRGDGEMAASMVAEHALILCSNSTTLRRAHRPSQRLSSLLRSLRRQRCSVTDVEASIGQLVTTQSSSWPRTFFRQLFHQLHEATCCLCIVIGTFEVSELKKRLSLPISMQARGRDESLVV